MAWQLGLRMPMIAAVNGACAGIALALAAFCDLRFAVGGAKVTAATARLGLPAEYGLSWMLPRLIGPAHAADVLLTGRVLRTEELGAMGFFNAVLPRPEFERRVADYAAMLAAASPEAVADRQAPAVGRPAPRRPPGRGRGEQGAHRPARRPSRLRRGRGRPVREAAAPLHPLTAGSPAMATIVRLPPVPGGGG